MQAALAGAGAEVMQAVPTMLELVPEGVNKWVGMRALLEDLVRQSSQCLRNVSANYVASRLVSEHIELQQQASWSCDRWELVGALAVLLMLLSDAMHASAAF